MYDKISDCKNHWMPRVPENCDNGKLREWVKLIVENMNIRVANLSNYWVFTNSFPKLNFPLFLSKTSSYNFMYLYFMTTKNINVNYLILSDNINKSHKKLKRNIIFHQKIHTTTFLISFLGFRKVESYIVRNTMTVWVRWNIESPRFCPVAVAWWQVHHFVCCPYFSISNRDALWKYILFLIIPKIMRQRVILLIASSLNGWDPDRWEAYWWKTPPP